MKNFLTKLKKLRLSYKFGLIGLILPLTVFIPYKGLFIFIILNPFSIFLGFLTAFITMNLGGLSQVLLSISFFIFSGLVYYVIGGIISKAKKETTYTVLLFIYIIIHIFAAKSLIHGVQNFSFP